MSLFSQLVFSGNETGSFFFSHMVGFAMSPRLLAEMNFVSRDTRRMMTEPQFNEVYVLACHNLFRPFVSLVVPLQAADRAPQLYAILLTSLLRIGDYSHNHPYPQVKSRLNLDHLEFHPSMVEEAERAVLYLRYSRMKVNGGLTFTKGWTAAGKPAAILGLKQTDDSDYKTPKTEGFSLFATCPFCSSEISYRDQQPILAIASFGNLRFNDSLFHSIFGPDALDRDGMTERGRMLAGIGDGGESVDPSDHDNEKEDKKDDEEEEHHPTPTISVSCSCGYAFSVSFDIEKPTRCTDSLCNRRMFDKRHCSDCVTRNSPETFDCPNEDCKNFPYSDDDLEFCTTCKSSFFCGDCATHCEDCGRVACHDECGRHWYCERCMKSVCEDCGEGRDSYCETCEECLCGKHRVHWPLDGDSNCDKCRTGYPDY
jgi:hypothetical protein